MLYACTRRLRVRSIQAKRAISEDRRAWGVSPLPGPDIERAEEPSWVLQEETSAHVKAHEAAMTTLFKLEMEVVALDPPKLLERCNMRPHLKL
jgi:hypothetical protein